jgi:uncharacterized damage-inducible protein DinB
VKPAGGELPRLRELLERSFRGPAWHGPSVRESLEGVTASMAAARPPGTMHSIGELVLHMATWKKAVALRIAGQPYAPSNQENFPPFEARDWKRALATLRRQQAHLRRALGDLRQDRLAEPAVPGGSPVFIQAHGAIHHDLWHAGQILVLRRRLEAEGRRRRR